jgi:hypothetical protein
VSRLTLYLLLALALVAVLVSLRLFLFKPRERPPDYRAAFGADERAALRDLLSDPDNIDGRAAEQRADWEAARDAYARALETLGRADRDDPGRALKLRALESKIEEIERRLAERG